MLRLEYILILICVFLLPGCRSDGDADSSTLLFERRGYPAVTYHDGVFYYTMQGDEGQIELRKVTDLTDLPAASPKRIYEKGQGGLFDIWSPELCRVGGKWYVYFEGDDGNTDNHQLYVLENPSPDPMEGEWTLNGPIMTNGEWNYGIHPSSLVVGGRQYLFWSGWPSRRVETETQCIYVAEMADPWTLKSERVLISLPEHEWERQWIGPDGSRTAYPIFVNENPAPFMSPDGSKVMVGYSASGIWTPYATLGLLYADFGADLLDPESWTKLPEPQISVAEGDTLTLGASNVAVVTDAAGSSTLLYEAISQEGPWKRSDIRMKTISWDASGIPVFGHVN